MYLYHHIPAIALYRSVEGGFLFQLLCSLWCVPIIGYIIWSECHIRISLSSLCRLILTLRWRHNARDGVSNHQRHDCLLNSLFGRRSKKTSKLCVAGLCAGKSPGTGEFPAQMASYAENVAIWWRHHDTSHYHQPRTIMHSLPTTVRGSSSTREKRSTGAHFTNSLHKWPVTRKMFPFDDVIMKCWRY